MASTLRQNYATGDDTAGVVYGNAWRAQSFTVVADHSIDQVDLYLQKVLAPTGNLILEIFAVDDAYKPTGSALATKTIACSAIPAGPGWVAFVLDASYASSAGIKYAIVIRGPVGDGSNHISWRTDANSSPGYTTGNSITSANAGVVWTLIAANDSLFKEYGDFSVDSVTPVDKTYSRKLVTIANNELWYESAPDTMSELAAAKNDIDVTEPLTIVEAFQKVFIANGTNLKVIDFINTKLTIAALTTAPTRGSTVTQSTGATMIVDFVKTDKTEIYGYTTSGTFDTTGTLSGGSMDPEDKVPSVVNQASTTPHWYDWTVYPGGSAGTMPTSAYLVALYRARVILAGHPSYPHMWYMPKVADPYNWLYSTAPLDAVNGNSPTVSGQVGDIIRTIIVYGDDFLIFGCANSIQILTGDPQSGGSIDEASDKTGIFSFTSWTRDEDGNLYFFGNHGIYLMAGGRSNPVNITKNVIPNFATDWAVNPLTHRVVLAYDAENRGIVIVKTVLADGTCSGYFYSLDTQGFYPISFGNTADGIYCAFDYNADDPTYRKLLFGCADGYIRKFLGTNKNDDVGDASSTEPILSYFTTIEPLSQDSDKKGKLTSLTIEMSGGGTGGAFADSDGCSYATYVANDAETVLERSQALVAWATGTTYAVGDLVTYSSIEYICIVAHTADDSGPPNEEPDTNTTDWEPATFSTGALTGVGRKNRIRDKIRAAWLAIKFFNSTVSETFGINKIFGDVKEVGKIKGK